MNTQEQQLMQKVDAWVDAHKDAFVEDVKKLVAVKSVSVSDTDVKPFGQGCRNVVEAAMKMCEEYGFPAKNHEYYCCTALSKGKTDKTIGIFGHLDVVPEGNDWSADPYTPYVKDGYIIGRGSGDNKGPVVASLYTMRCLKELGIELDHNLLLFMGCAEETGMGDVKYYLENNPAPDFSYTPDSMYSVCHGEKGVLQAQFSRDIAGGNLVSFKGGQITNAVADRAEAVLSGVNLADAQKALEGYDNISAAADGGNVKVVAIGTAAHAAFPEGSVNAIWTLAKALSEQKLVTGPALEAMSFITAAFVDNYGTGLGMDFEDDISGKTTCVGGVVFMEGSLLTQDINVRYAIKTDVDAMKANLEKKLAENGFALGMFDDNKPTYMPADHPAIQSMDATVAEFYGDKFKPFVMGGGTYARKIPNAVGWGPGTSAPSPFGGGHQPDEGVNIEELLTAIRLYVLGLTRLDKLV